MQPEAVIFDIGNVLTRWQPEAFYDREIGPERRQRLFAEVDLHAMNEIVDAGGLFRETIYDWAARHPGWAAEIRLWYDRWIDLASPRIEGSIALLRALRAKGVPVFNLTNFGSYSYDEARDKLDFLNEFDREYVSGRMGVTKPDPRIYQMVEEDCGLSPDRLLFTDDRADNITAAARRGWRTHQFESWEGWAARLVAEGLLRPNGGRAMSVETIGPEAERSLTWDGLRAALEAGHRLPRAEIADLLLYRDADTLLDRAAWIDGLGALVKVGTIVPGNTARGKPTVNGIVNLFDDQTGELTALIDFHLVTKWKTAGDSLLSASRLARKDSRNFLLVGAGTVARSMVEAYRSVWPAAQFTIWSRSRATAESMGLPVADDLEAAVRSADVICTATMATEPLIKGDWLQPGQHLDLIGAYTPAMREVDDTAMRRARIFVDARATTVHHIGELMAPIASGAITEADVIADFYDDPATFVRRSEEEITIAKNGGGAHLDLMTATYIASAWANRS